MVATFAWILFVTCLWATHVQLSRSEGHPDFTYFGKYGPEHWAEQFHQCAGKHQSPININVFNVTNRPLWPIHIDGFDRKPTHAHVLNNGHTITVHLEYVESSPNIALGPLEGIGIFNFVQLHFHWGQNNSLGSEDRINNKSYPAELHAVFYNNIYPSFDKAITQPNGIAVMGFFFRLQTADNPNYVELIDLLADVKEAGRKAAFLRPPALQDLIVKDLNNYFTYTGSLTTPPCNEDVVWMDFTTPIMISFDQIDAFRHLNTYSGKPLTHNFRPVQPLNNRTIFKPISYPMFPSDSTDHSVVSSIPFVDNINSATALRATLKRPSTMIATGTLGIFSIVLACVNSYSFAFMSWP